MLDPDFDPLKELEILKHNQQQLIIGLNHFSELLKELSRQHQLLISEIKDIKQRLK